MRITPEQFETFRNVFFGIVILFMGFVGIKILMFEHRRKHPQPPPPPRRRPSSTPPPTAGDEIATFGISGMSASDMAVPSFDSGSGGDSGASSEPGGGGEASGGGDFSGGGGEGGGGGASGGWND